MSEMSVERPLVAEGGHHLAQIAQVASQLFWRDRRILPSFPVQRLARNVRGRTQARLANLPHSLGLRAGIESHVRRIRAAVEGVDQSSSLGFSFLRGLSAE